MYSRADDARAGLRRRPELPRSSLHTDAIWRACRIILDVRMHRGELSVEEATEFLVEQTSFEGANARAEVQRYTYTPDLPAVVPARARSCSSASAPTSSGASASAFSLRAFHDALLRNGSLPISFHRRLLRRRGRASERDLSRAGHPGDRPRTAAARGSSSGPARRPASGPRPIGPSGSPSSSSARRAAHPPRRLRWRAVGRPGEPRGGRGDRRRGSPSRSSWPAAWTRPTGIRLAFAAGATRVVLATAIADRPDDLRACLAVAGDWLAVGLDPRPERFAAFPWRRAAPPTIDGLVEELVGAGVRRLRPDPRRDRAGPRAGCVRSSGRTMPRSSSPAGSATSTVSAALRDTGVAGVILGEALLSGAIDFPQPWRPPHDPPRSLVASPCRSSASLVAAVVGACSGARRGGRRLERLAPPPRPRPSRTAGACPTRQPAATAGGRDRTSRSRRTKGAIGIKVEADLSPIAAGNFVALAACGYYDGVSSIGVRCRSFVIQGGDPTGTGTGGPGYTIKDEPVTRPYGRGTVAMARTAGPDSVGSQFFIVLDDKAATSSPTPTPTRSSDR